MSEAFDRLVGIMNRLREPGGCPWDREQTLETLSGYMLEEAHEVTEAIRSGDGPALCEELGDFFFFIRSTTRHDFIRLNVYIKFSSY